VCRTNKIQILVLHGAKANKISGFLDLLTVKTSDALELKFGEPSRAELEICRADPSRAGRL
jgi:hypothetical protein